MIKVHNGSWHLRLALTSTVATIALAGTAPTFAQGMAEPAAPVASQIDEGAQGDAAEDIVVTGTLIRGVAPIGTNVVGLSREQITATGATNTNDVLAKIPQISNFFNKIVNTGLGDGAAVSARPDIRNLSTFGGGNSTLLLVDGQRVAGVGVIYTSPDPDVIPPGALERVEVVADGGSSIYGSDAVGGVINLITRKRYQGLQVSGRAGFADNYYQYDANAIAGTEWDTGGVYVSGTYSKHDDLFGRDRDYIRNFTPSNSCSPPTLTVNGSTTYALPGRVPGTVNKCDTSDNAALTPEERRYSILTGFNQQFGENIDFNVRGYYTNRKTITRRDQNRTSVSVPATNPYYITSIGGSQNVAFSYAPAFGPHNVGRTNLEQWGITPSLSVRFNPEWELRLSTAYSESDVRNIADAINPQAEAAALAGTTTATALNPYDIAATNPAVLARIGNWEENARGQQNVFTARGVLNGTLFSWAGRDVRLAVGGEYLREEIKSHIDQRIPGGPATAPGAGGSRNVKSVYGELALPIFGADNRAPGFHSLLISASGRYDRYSDVGGTFNPKIGIDWKPFSALRLRANYGTSFNAPSLADLNATDRRFNITTAGLFNILLRRPGDPLIPTILRPVIVLAGGNENLRPQKAKTFSAGFDFDAPFAPGLKISGTYWKVDFKDQISLPTSCLLDQTLTYSPVCSRFVTPNPTLAQVNALASNILVSGAFPTVEAAFANPFLPPYALFDARRVNIGRVKTDGIDFNVGYVRPTSFGSINASVGGAWLLSRRSQYLSDDYVDELRTGVSTLNLAAGLGATIGDFSAQATLYHSGGYRTAGTAAAAPERVGSFNVVNLFLSYDLKGEGLTKDLSFTLNVNNLFDTDPPYVSSGNSYANGSTLGRLVQIGVSKKF